MVRFTGILTETLLYLAARCSHLAIAVHSLFFRSLLLRIVGHLGLQNLGIKKPRWLERGLASLGNDARIMIENKHRAKL